MTSTRGASPRRLRGAVYLVFRAIGSIVALATIVSLVGGEHPLQELGRYARTAGLDALSLALLQADAEAVRVLVVMAPWVSASLLLTLLLVIATEGRLKHLLASTAAVLFGVMLLCPPIEPLAWILLVAVFGVPAFFVFRAHGFSRTLPSLQAAALALALAVLWILVWPETLRRTLARRHVQPTSGVSC